MFNFMVTNECGLTTAGYAIAIIAGIILFWLQSVLQENTQKNTN